jgi:hypothetical protein
MRVISSDTFNHANQRIRIQPYLMENTNVPYIDNNCKKVSGFISTKKIAYKNFGQGTPRLILRFLSSS